MSKKVVHLIPYDGIGGVETAVRSISKFKRDGIEVKVDYIFKMSVSSRWKWTTFSPLVMFSAAKRIITSDADLLVVSLWRSAIVGVLAKCMRSRLKLVLFIHSTLDAHWLDFIVTRLAVRVADEVWADSPASLRLRVPNLAPDKSRIISFVTQRIEALPPQEARPDFIFWGRINAVKGFDRALRIFAEVLKRNPDARFWIIGPDGGALQSTKQLCKSLGLVDRVYFLGAATLTEIAVHARKATFYLQTSRYEGMAMSVVEAMQMGLVPVVTPVGEIESYCSHSINALIVKSDRQAADDVGHLLVNHEKYQRMRLNAIATWQDKQLYSESVFHACEALLKGSK